MKFNYQSIGSGGGIKQITAGTVDFGATDAVMKDEDMAKIPGPIFHIPTAMGAVSVVYNIVAHRSDGSGTTNIFTNPSDKRTEEYIMGRIG